MGRVLLILTTLLGMVLIALGLLATLLFTNPEPTHSSQAIVQVPGPVPTIQWFSTLTSQYGIGSAEAGTQGLEFGYDSRPPAYLLNFQRSYIGNELHGTLMPTSPITTSNYITWTFQAAFSDVDNPHRFTLEIPCHMELPIQGYNYVAVTGTISSVDCGTIRSGEPCLYTAQLSGLSGQYCSPHSNLKK